MVFSQSFLVNDQFLCFHILKVALLMTCDQYMANMQVLTVLGI